MLFNGAIVIAFVPTTTMKDIFSQQEVSGRRCKWINRIQEFNIDIQITKLVRGQGLAKLMIDANIEANQINQLGDNCREDLCDMDISDWYKDVIYYLQTMKSPSELTDNQRRSLKLHAIRYVIVQGQLCWRDMEGVLLKCVDET